MQSLYKTALENFAHTTNHTATILVSANRYTYVTSDLKATGHFTEPNKRKFRRALALETHCLTQKGYLVQIQHSPIEM
ncbi:hypothetical protein [Pseudanabaena sp. 'Roaring Creek']|uniref:hypothetical protein n=1 Tax=Pseudanabaena sp. 'Roaring Creek' TaxID=1681830 RepID=UPI0012E2070E|nr:hypothetical protein [Pseudanabaena sp. 'Roaring Creek']